MVRWHGNYRVYGNRYASFFGNSEIMEQEREAVELARKARAAEGSERAELEEQLESLLEGIFDEKMQMRKESMARLEKELSEKKIQFETRQAARREVIERRKAELLGKEDVLEW